MRKIKIIFIVFISLYISGCGIALQSTMPVHRFGKNYEIDKIYTVNTGSPMITVYNLYLFPEYKPKYTFDPPNAGVVNTPPLTPDQKWIAFYSHKNNYIIQSKDYISFLGIEIKPNGELGNTQAWINLNPIGPKVRMLQSTWKLPDPQLFVKTEGYPKEGSFKAELIYNGIMNGVISISYREFIDNLARVAFYQELKYDLKESNEISFRTIKIKVLDATNNEIAFKVLDDGGLPWMPLK